MWQFVKYSTLLFYLKKYKSSLLVFCGVLFLLLITDTLHRDIRTHLLDTDQKHLLIYALIIKWICMLGISASGLYLILKEPGSQKDQEPPVTSNSKTAENPKNEINAHENELLSKKKLRSRSDQIIECAKARKASENKS